MLFSYIKLDRVLSILLILEKQIFFFFSMLTFTAIIFLPCTILAILPKVLVCCVFILFFRILLISLLTSFSTHGCVFLCGVLGSVSIDRFSPH